MEFQQVVLVDDRDAETGVMEKIAAHQTGVLHRAFSVFIFNSKGEMLLQQRALNKYHSPGLWSNSCCSHPRPGEDIIASAQRRLQEEMGFTVFLEKIFDFIYREDLDDGMIEHEFDHVFAGKYDGPVKYASEEVMDYCFKSMEDISLSLKEHPQKFTKWFQLAFPKVEEWWQRQYRIS